MVLESHSIDRNIIFGDFAIHSCIMITADSSESYRKKCIYTRIIFPAPCRLLLQKVQAMKNIKMVKKYRDGRGRARVVSQLTISVSDGGPMFLLS